VTPSLSTTATAAAQGRRLHRRQRRRRSALGPLLLRLVTWNDFSTCQPGVPLYSWPQYQLRADWYQVFGDQAGWVYIGIGPCIDNPAACALN